MNTEEFTATDSRSSEATIGNDPSLPAMSDLFEPYPEMEPRQFTIEDMIPRGYITLLHADGGHCKSYIAMQIAISVAIGKPIYGRKVLASPVLYADFELKQEDLIRRASEVGKGMGLPGLPKKLILKSYVPESTDIDEGIRHNDNGNELRLNGSKDEFLPELFEDLNDEVKEKGCGLVIIDSFGAAIGDPDDTQEACKMFKKLLGLGTVLVIDHQAKIQNKPGESYDKKTAYGSVYKSNLSRAVWQVKKDRNRITLTEKKRNFNKEQEPIELNIKFNKDRDKVTITKASKTTSKKAAGKSDVEKLEKAFGKLKEATIKELAAGSELPESKVRRIVLDGELKNKVQEVGKKPSGSGRPATCFKLAS